MSNPASAIAPRTPIIGENPRQRPAHNLCTRIVMVIALAIIFPIIPILFCVAKNWLSRKWEIVTGETHISIPPPAGSATSLRGQASQSNRLPGGSSARALHIREFDQATLSTNHETRNLTGLLQGAPQIRINPDMTVAEAAVAYARQLRVSGHLREGLQLTLTFQGRILAIVTAAGYLISNNPDLENQNFRGVVGNTAITPVLNEATTFNSDSLGFLENFLRANHPGDDLPLTLTSIDNQLYKLSWRRSGSGFAINITNAENSTDTLTIRFLDNSTLRGVLMNGTDFTQVYDQTHIWSRRLASFTSEIRSSGVADAGLRHITPDSLRLLNEQLRQYGDIPHVIADHEGSAHNITSALGENGAYTINIEDTLHPVEIINYEREAAPNPARRDISLQFDSYDQLTGVMINGVVEADTQVIFDAANIWNSKLACFYRRLEAVGSIETPDEAEPAATPGAPAAAAIEDKAWLKLLPKSILQNHTGEASALQLPSGERIWSSAHVNGYRLNIKSQDNTQTLEVVFNMTHRIQSAVFNGAEIDAQRLNNPSDPLYNMVNAFFEHTLATRGIVVNAHTIQVHPFAIERCPETVLTKAANLFSSNRQLNVVFLNNNLVSTGAIDAGGPSRDFISALGKALFSPEAQRRRLHITTQEVDEQDEPLPILGDNPSLETTNLYRHFGSLISYVLQSHRGLRIGTVLNQQFYDFLKAAVIANGNYEALLINLRRSQITHADTDTGPALDWLADPVGKPAHIATYLAETLYLDPPEGKPSWHDPRIETADLVASLKENLEDAYKTNAKATLAIFQGLSPAARAYFGLAATTGVSACERVQGVSITAEKILAKLATRNIEQSGISPAELILFNQRVDWIRARVTEKAEDLPWLKSFVKCLTGQTILSDAMPLLLAPTSIHSPPLVRASFFAHTCFGRLDCPVTAPLADDPDPQGTYIELLQRLMDDEATYTAG